MDLESDSTAIIGLRKYSARAEDLAEALMKIQAFWNMMICRSTDSSRHLVDGDSNHHIAENYGLLIAQYVTWSSRFNDALNFVESDVTKIHVPSATGRLWLLVRNSRH